MKIRLAPKVETLARWGLVTSLAIGVLAAPASAQSELRALERCQSDLRRSVLRLHTFATRQIGQCLDGVSAGRGRAGDRCDGKVVKLRRSFAKAWGPIRRRCLERGRLTDVDLRELLTFDRLLFACGGPFVDRTIPADPTVIMDEALACIEGRVVYSTGLDFLALRPRSCEQHEALLASVCETPEPTGASYPRLETDTRGCLEPEAAEFFEDLFGGCNDAP